MARTATYTDGTPVRPGDRVRYHQAPGGLLPHGDWRYGTALPNEKLNAGVSDCLQANLYLHSDEPGPFGARWFGIAGHVVERATDMEAVR